jgi:hypothetical protein
LLNKQEQEMATKAPAKKTRVTKAQVIAHRTRAVKDHSPSWEGQESMSAEEFNRYFRHSMDYYRLEHSGKDLKPKVINWMAANGYTKEQIKSFKDTKDNRCNLTMGAIAANLLRGMPAQRADFNEGRNTAQWLGAAIAKVADEGKNDERESEDGVVEVKSTAGQPSIQERVREAAARMTDEIEDAIELFSQDPDTFDPKAFKLLNLLRGKGVKAAHARIIKDFYVRQHEEYVEVQAGKCEQLKEGYSHISKKNIKKITDFYGEILSACDMLAQEAKINRAPRTKKPTDKSKVVAKLKYLKQDDKLKLVSVNPIDIVGSQELWIYNTKTRKIGKYVAEEYKELGVKGTTITGFSESKSVQKTLRKPEDQIKEFKAAGKVQLRKFLDDIKAVDIKLNGRINEDTILLKVQ